MATGMCRTVVIGCFVLVAIFLCLAFYRLPSKAQTGANQSFKTLRSWPYLQGKLSGRDTGTPGDSVSKRASPGSPPTSEPPTSPKSHPVVNDPVTKSQGQETGTKRTTQVEPVEPQGKRLNRPEEEKKSQEEASKMQEQQKSDPIVVAAKSPTKRPAPPAPPAPRSSSLCPEKPSRLVGKLSVSEDVQPELDRIAKESQEDGMQLGGFFSPRSCTPRSSIAIIVPFRDREEHLHVFLHYMVPILRRQLLEFRIYITEQMDDMIFNRGAVMNVGYLEARKDKDWDCYAWHDVDLVIENDNNMYFCPPNENKAIHLTTLIHRNKRNWKPYATCFGGASIMTKTQVTKTNGYSNVYWGWGGEDDDLFYRLRANGMGFGRPSEALGTYTMLLKHHKSAKLNPLRFKQLKTRESRFKGDGINSVKYDLVDRKLFPLYTRIQMKLHKTKWDM